MSHVRTLLLDLDGTIIDSIQLILDSYDHTLATHGMPAQTREYWLSGLGTPLRAQLGPFARTDAELEALVATYREFNHAHHDRMVRCYPGVAEAVRTIRGTGRPIGIVTSKRREGTLLGLRLAGLQSSVDAIVAADDVERPKPHPEPVHRAVALLGADPATTLFVGDSVHDMQAGREAGVLTGAALWGPFGRTELAHTSPTVWLETPEDLLNFLRHPRMSDGVASPGLAG